MPNLRIGARWSGPHGQCCHGETRLARREPARQLAVAHHSSARRTVAPRVKGCSPLRGFLLEMTGTLSVRGRDALHEHQRERFHRWNGFGPRRWRPRSQALARRQASSSSSWRWGRRRGWWRWRRLRRRDDALRAARVRAPGVRVAGDAVDGGAGRAPSGDYRCADGIPGAFGDDACGDGAPLILGLAGPPARAVRWAQVVARRRVGGCGSARAVMSPGEDGRWQSARCGRWRW